MGGVTGSAEIAWTRGIKLLSSEKSLRNLFAAWKDNKSVANGKAKVARAKKAKAPDGGDSDLSPIIHAMEIATPSTRLPTPALPGHSAMPWSRCHSHQLRAPQEMVG